jgi:ArsR family transcriptional regulator, arsenate/arsenite/antimonite-responsive transcriptional repressor
MKQSNTAKLFKALSNEQRLKIFLMLYARSQKDSGKAFVDPAKETCCCPMEKVFTKVCQCMSLSQSTVSHHLKALQDAGLISCKREGQKFVCTINEAAIQSIRDFLR